MRTLVSLQTGLILATLVGGGCMTKDAPAQPTWVDDVQPILLGNCFHCHGADVGRDKDGNLVRPGGPLVDGSARYDIYNPMDYLEAVGRQEDLDGIAAISPRVGLLAGILLVEGRGESRMPPSPALPLPEYEVKVLKNWIAAKMPKGTRPNNSKPRAVLVVRPVTQGANTVVTFDVFDDDGDQVLGRIEGGTGKPQVIGRSGRHTFLLEGAATAAPKVFLSDSWITVEQELR